jgi:hypothetical protein
MLAGWGATCGRCKPKLAYPKTVMLAASDAVGLMPLVLGWLVITKTPADVSRGQLIDLSASETILSRAGGAVTGPQVIPIEDVFMSDSHAIIRRPAQIGPNAAFTVEDRRNPSPSKNGTWLNLRKLGPNEAATLGDGDIIRVGTTDLIFRSLILPAASPSRT